MLVIPDIHLFLPGLHHALVLLVLLLQLCAQLLLQELPASEGSQLRCSEPTDELIQLLIIIRMSLVIPWLRHNI